MNKEETNIDSNYVKVPVDLWNKWMQEREDYKQECEILRLDISELGMKLEAMEKYIEQQRSC